MNRLNFDQEKQLIEYFRDNPSLWNTKDRDYNNRMLRTQKLETIAQFLHLTSLFFFTFSFYRFLPIFFPDYYIDENNTRRVHENALVEGASFRCLSGNIDDDDDGGNDANVYDARHFLSLSLSLPFPHRMCLCSMYACEDCPRLLC